MNTDLKLTRFWFIFCLVVILVGSAIRIHNLAHDSFWIDEILTATFSRHDLKTAALSDPHHPPLFYILTSLSIQLLGEDEFTVRVPALFAGILGIALTIQMGKTLRQPWAGLWAAVFLILSPYHLRHSQEARHYTLLMAMSLLSYIVLIWAMKRPSWRMWLVYAAVTVVNLYTHYGAFIVLATQATIIAVWGTWQVWRKQYTSIKYIPVAAAVIVVLYLPWIPRLLESLRRNVGQDIVSDTGPAATLWEWLRISFHTFALYDNQIYAVLPFLMAFSLILWLMKRQWTEIVFIVTSLALPFLLIQIFGIARGAYARYVIYTFPFLLLLVAIVPTTLLWPLYERRKKWAFLLASSSLAIILALVSRPFIQREYSHIIEDWRGILQYLDAHADENDVVLGLSLSFPNGLNTVSASLPYYLPAADKNYFFLGGHALSPEQLDDLPRRDVTVWAIVHNWTVPMEFSRPSLKVIPFQSSLFLIEDSEPDEETLQQMVDLYEAFLAQPMEAIHQCLLYQDLAALSVVKESYWLAYSWLERSVEQCPESPPHGIRPQLTETILSGLPTEISLALANNNEALARDIATVILLYDDKSATALAALTYEDLLHRFQMGLVEVNDENSPEPVDVRRFLMPENGDERDVLFIHPPTTVSFSLELPTEPVVFRATIGLDPQSRGWGGDGVTFTLNLSDESGQTTELFRQHLNNDESGYGWHNVQLSLVAYAGQTVTLTLATETGSAGSATGDWAGWATPRLLWLDG